MFGNQAKIQYSAPEVFTAVTGGCFADLLTWEPLEKLRFAARETGGESEDLTVNLRAVNSHPAEEEGDDTFADGGVNAFLVDTVVFFPKNQSLILDFEALLLRPS